MGGPLLPKVGMRRIYAYYDSMVYSTFKVASVVLYYTMASFLLFIYLLLFFFESTIVYNGFNSAELPLLEFYFIFYFFYIASFI